MIKCRICGKEYMSVGYLHLRTHNINWTEYKALYPDVKRMNAMEISIKQSERNKGNTYRLGVPHTEQTKVRMSLSRKGQKRFMGCHHTKEARERMSIKRLGNTYRLGIPHSEEVKAKITQSLQGNKRTLGYRKTKEQRVKHQAVMSSPEVRERLKESRRKWLEKNGGKLPAIHRQNVVRAVMKAQHARPNKPEQQLLNILGGSWEYVGNGNLIIGNKCPDFWNGDHKLIELYGDYWHRGENPQDRISFFKQYGYGCLVIWERELGEVDEVKRKIQGFVLK